MKSSFLQMGSPNSAPIEHENYLFRSEWARPSHASFSQMWIVVLPRCCCHPKRRSLWCNVYSHSFEKTEQIRERGKFRLMSPKPLEKAIGCQQGP